MAEQLGKIEKLEVEHFRKGKKLYLVPLIYFSDEAPGEYKEKCSRYWQQVEEQLNNLASKIGRVNRVYHESVFQSGEEGMKAIQRLNPSSHQIAISQCDNGAILEPIEEKELFEEVMDWQRCLMLGFISEKVAGKVSELYVEAAKKRNELMAKKVNETLKDDEAGLLFISEGHSVQFPADIEVFSVFPPVLDEIHRWLRDQTSLGIEKAEAKAEEQAKGEAKEAAKPKVKGKPRKKVKREPED